MAADRMTLPGAATFPRWTEPAVVATFVVLMCSTWVRHTDVGDAQVYQVVARNMREDNLWTTLRYLPSVYPHFYEHLPFGLWPMVAAGATLGEWSLRPLFAAFSLGAVLLAGQVARRLGGRAAGLMTLLVLATTMNFFKDAGYPLLDPLLLLLVTASAIPLWAGIPSFTGWAAALAFAAMAVAVKGPFGLIPFASAVLARSVVERSVRVFLLGALVGLTAATPTAVFLLARDDWWTGYVQHQLLASALGNRADGTGGALYAVRVIAGRFWPGLPLTALGLLLATGRPRRVAGWLTAEGAGELSAAELKRGATVLAISSVAMMVALSLPSRKLWHHTLVAWPALAALGGVAVAGRLEHFLRPPKRAYRFAVALGGLFAAAVAAIPLGLPNVLMNPACFLGAELSPHADLIQPGAPVQVVSGQDEWDMLSALAFERRAVPHPGSALSAPDRGGVALAREELWAGQEGWREVGRARGWVFLLADTK